MDAVTALSAQIAAMQNMMTTHFSNMSLGQQQAQINVVHQPQAWCEVCGGGDHRAEVCGANPDSVHFVGNAQRGGNHQSYGNTYNPSWRNHPNFSWGSNQNQPQGQNQYRPQSSGQQYHQQNHGNQQAAKQSDMSVEDMLKQIMADQAKLAADVRNNQLATQNLEKQFGQFASAQNSRPQGGLPGNTDPNPKQVNVVSTRSGRPLEELMPKEKVAQEKGTHVDEAKASEQRVNEEPKVKPPPPFPQKFRKQKEEECFGKFIELLKQVHVNLPLIDVLQGIPKYAKYVKDVVANKSRLAEYATVALTEECSSRIQNRLPIKLKDPGSFTVQIQIGKCVEARGLCDLGASINLMPISMFLKLGLGKPKPTIIMLQLADRSVLRPDGVI